MNTGTVPAPATAAADAAAAPAAAAEQVAVVPFHALLLPAIAGLPVAGALQADLTGGSRAIGQAAGLAVRAEGAEGAEGGEALPDAAGNGLPPGLAAVLAMLAAAAMHGHSAAAVPSMPAPGLAAAEGSEPAAEPAPVQTAGQRGEPPVGLLDVRQAGAANVPGRTLQAGPLPAPQVAPTAPQADHRASAASSPPPPAVPTAVVQAVLLEAGPLAGPRLSDLDLDRRMVETAAPGASDRLARAAPAASFAAAAGPAATGPHAGFAQPPGSPDWYAALGDRLHLMLNRGERQALIRLQPEELGRLEIRLALGAERVDLSFTVQHPAVAGAIQAHLPQLQQMLAAHGLSLGDASVSQQRPEGERENPGRRSPATAAAIEEVHAEVSPRTRRPLHGGLIDAYV